MKPLLGNISEELAATLTKRSRKREFAAEEEDLEPIEWWRWFQEFDRRNLQLVYDPSKGWFTLASRLAPSGG